MATAWVRSLSCRSSYAVTDAAIAPTPSKKPPPQPPAPPFSCATAAAADVMDAVAYAQQQARRKKMGRERERERRREAGREPRPPRPKKKPKPMAKAKAKDAAGALFMPSPAPAPPASSAFLTMAELPEGHSSRRVVELIFASGWGGGAAGAAGAPCPEPPTVEALFRVHSASRAVARFEEARAAARAHGAAARCGADGNEMMRFQCRGASPAGPDDTPGGVFGAGVATCRIGASASAVRTFACSGAAHASTSCDGGGGGATTGRRAMLVCRVIAGRVCPANHHPSPRHGHGSAASDYDSVDMGNGELVVLNSRAVLPCFLIIYKV